MNTVPKILVLDHTPFVGGAQLAVIELIKKINKAELEIIIVASQKAKDLGFVSDYEKAGLKYYLIPFLPWKNKAFFGIFNLLADLRKLIRIIRQENVDLIFSNTVRADILGALAAFLTRRKIVWYLLDYTFPRLLFRVLSRVVNKVYFVSRSVLLYYLGHENKKGGDGQVFYLWSNMIEKLANEKVESRDGGREALGVRPDDFLLVYLGRLVEHKGPQTIIEAISLCKEQALPVKALLIGTGKGQEGDNESDLIELTKKKNLEKEIIFLGAQKNVTPYLLIADALVLSTIGPEPFSSVVLEAMFSRVSVIATDTGGTKEINEPEEACLLIKPNDPTDLVRAINKLRLDFSLKQELIERAYARVSQKNAVSAAAGNWTKIFLDVLNKK